jgi:hypothetical protein
MKTTKLEKLSACRDAVEWTKTQKSPKDAWMNCNRGDWMLWIAKRLDVDDRLLTLAKATCANQVRHLMTDKQSTDAIDACFRYARGEITREKLNIYADAAFTVADSFAAVAAAYAATFAADAAADAAAYASAAVDAAAQMDSLKKSADICREILTEEVLLKYKRLRK